MLALMAAFAAFAWWRGHAGVAVFLTCYAAANVVAALLAPRIFRWHAGLWQRLGRAGGTVLGLAMLTLAYYVVFTPGALLLRVLGKDPLRLRFPGREDTYWREVPERPDADYERQF